MCERASVYAGGRTSVRQRDLNNYLHLCIYYLFVLLTFKPLDDYFANLALVCPVTDVDLDLKKRRNIFKKQHLKMSLTVVTLSERG